MMKEEAADLLENLIGMVEDNQENDYDEALKMAIEALNVTDTNVGDTISRQAAIDAILQRLDALKGLSFGTSTFRDGIADGYARIMSDLKALPSAQPEPRWIPVKTRPMDEEERKYYLEELGWSLDDNEAVMFDSLMPGDGQEVWVCSKCGNVWQDTCVIDEGIGLEENGDWLDIVAWMPFERPEPWKGEEDECMDV